VKHEQISFGLHAIRKVAHVPVQNQGHRSGHTIKPISTNPLHWNFRYRRDLGNKDRAEFRIGFEQKKMVRALD
jgi:hypothetical protein